MADTPKRPKITNSPEDLRSPRKPDGGKKVSSTESGNVKGGASTRKGTNDDSV